MLNSRDFEKIFFLYTRINTKYLKSINRGFYDENPEIDLLSHIQNRFFERFKEIPSKEQLKVLCGDVKFKDKINSEIIDQIFSEDISTFDEQWLIETTESWILWRNFNESIINTIEYTKSVKVTPDNVKEIVNKAKIKFLEKNNINFDNNLGLNFFEADSHFQESSNKISSGHRWVDNYLSGGYDLKTLICYIGQSAVGKSIWLCNDAANFCLAGFDVAYITAEMSEKKIIRRIGSNMLNINMDEYDRVSRDKNKMNRLISTKRNSIIPPGNLWVKEYPTSQATVLDIETYLKDLEESKGIKLKVVVVDYINILCNYRNPNSENTYMNIKQIAQDLRAMAIRNNWLIISVTQINRNSFDSSDLHVSDISESAALYHTLDVMYGIIQDPEMYVNNTYWLKILKIRDGKGKNSKCKYDIDYNYMRLKETEEIYNGE
jgi:replicative DNA helicase